MSNVAYPIAGWHGDWFTFIGGIILSLGSGWMHYEDEIVGERSNLSILADYFGIYAFTFSILAYHTNPFVLAILAPIISLRNDMRDQNLVGFSVLITILVTQSFLALPVFGLALFVRNKWEHTKWQDYSHSAWHILSGLGYYLILL